MSISATSGYADPPISAAQQKADLQKIAAQYTAQRAQGNAADAARAVAADVKSAAAGAGINLTAARATQAVNNVVAQTEGGSAQAPLLQIPVGVAAQQADVQKLAATYHALRSQGGAEQAVRDVGGTVQNDAGNTLRNVSLGDVTGAVAQAIGQSAATEAGLNLIG